MTEQFSIVTWLFHRLGLPSAWAHDGVHVILAGFVACYLTILSFFAWRKLRHTDAAVLPDGYTTIGNLFEIVVGAIIRLMEDVMGAQAKQHLPLIGALFIYIATCNLLGVIPGFLSPTENINTGLACALVVFVYYNVVGIRKQGLRTYLKHMSGPVLWLAPLMFAIEVVSHLVRPLSLSVRLMGNISGDHMVLGIFSSLVPLVLPIVFMMLAIFVCLMQAFVFTLLSIIYIHMASLSEES